MQIAPPSDHFSVRALARGIVAAHVSVMVNRPCKPDPDLKWLWQTLLPGTPLPACPLPEQSDADVGENVTTTREPEPETPHVGWRARWRSR